MKRISKLIVILLIISISVSMMSGFASASASDRKIAWGAANSGGDGVRVRSGPSLSSDVLTHAMKGDPIVIIERTNSEWYYVNYNGTVGYMSVPFLDRPRTVADFNAEGKVTGNGVNLRERPNTASSTLGAYDEGTAVSIIGLNEGWYKVCVNDKTGYIRSDLMTVTPSADRGSDAAPSLGRQIADFALGLKGSKYVAGGASPSGFDCSGFTYYVYKQFNITLTRNSAGQYRDNGTHIAKSELLPGDLIFSSNNGSTVTHVGIYVGDNKMVHAQTSATGVVVSRIDIGSYSSGFIGAKRIVGTN